jgi:hypothetical protein
VSARFERVAHAVEVFADEVEIEHLPVSFAV